MRINRTARCCFFFHLPFTSRHQCIAQEWLASKPTLSRQKHNKAEALSIQLLLAFALQGGWEWAALGREMKPNNTVEIVASTNNSSRKISAHLWPPECLLADCTPRCWWSSVLFWVFFCFFFKSVVNKKYEPVLLRNGPCFSVWFLALTLAGE